MRRTRPKRRLSLITDAILFAVVMIIVFPLINTFNLSVYNTGNKLERIENINEALPIVAIKSQTDEIDKQNEYLIEYIKKSYGVTIKYGIDSNQLTKMVNANLLNNEYIANVNINKLKESLEKYPSDFFNIFKLKNNRYTLTLVLVDKFNNDNLALAAKTNYSKYTIYISNTEEFNRAFHHEMFHIMEYYISDIKSNNNLFSNWNNLNPSGFKYSSNIENLNWEYVYKDNLDLSTVYFITRYSKFSNKEDRAEIFAELMNNNKRPKYLNGYR